ncbi:hypothetical protein Lal_00029753 [Lupinus albus]|nr:hypothetical protein Lal_00029753 [Lupinus albus]
MMGTTLCFTFTTTNAVPQPINFSGNFCNTLCLGLPLTSNPFSHCRVKLSSFSIPRKTHLQVSQNSLTPTEDSISSSPPSIGDNDLLVVGPGVLGRLVAHKWQQEIPGCQVFGQTITTDHHSELIQLGINPSLKWIEATHKFPNVIFCAPPSRTPDYADNISLAITKFSSLFQLTGWLHVYFDLLRPKRASISYLPFECSAFNQLHHVPVVILKRLAASSWNGEGCILFTSSSAPYDCSDNGPCNEDTPVVPVGRVPRIDVLLKAENRGAHNYYLEKGIVDTRPDHILNLIHYEDAASLSVAILKKKFRGQIFLGCDNHPLSRQEMMDLVNKSGKFSKKFDRFTGTNDHLGKRLNNTRTRGEVGWEPKYPSFAHFLESI